MGSAYAIGRGPDGYQQLLAALQGGRFEVTPVIQFNQQAARDYLTRWAGMLDRPAKNATLRLEAGEPIVTPAEDGLRLDVERTLAGLAADPSAVMASGGARVFFEPVQAQVQDVRAAEDQVRELLGLNLAGVVYDPISDERISWSIPPATIASWIRVEQDQDGYQARLDEASLVDYLARLDENLDLGPGRTVAPLADPAAAASEMLAGQTLSLLARHLPGEYTVQGGETLFQVGWKVGIQYWRMLKANPGVNPNGLRAGQKLVVPSLDDQLPLPVVQNKRIVISIPEQHMWVYQDGELFREFVISTGIDRSPTQPGIYQVQTHELNAYAENWDLYMPHWMGIYEAWPGFMNGIHGLPMLSSGVRLWKNVLGRPASYGCVILDLPEAEWLYNWAENGVVVEIRG